MNEKHLSSLASQLRNHKLSMEELCDNFKRTEDEIKSDIKTLQERGHNVSISNGHRKKHLYYSINMLPEAGNVYKISEKDNKRRNMRFGAISDTHFASVFHLPKTFKETMKILEDSGIKRVYVAGDVVDGRGIYRGHEENLIETSVEKQTDMAAESFSKHPNLEFWGVAGNHDYSFTKKTGTKPLAILESKIDNFKNLGDLRADIIYRGIRMRLLHGGSGRTYARSYPSQVYLRDLFGGTEKKDMKDMPHIILLGHYHTLYNGKDHGIHIVQPGSFQDGDNEYCLRRGLTGPNGGYLIDFDYKNGQIDRFRTEYIQPNIREKGKAFARTARSYLR